MIQKNFLQPYHFNYFFFCAPHGHSVQTSSNVGKCAFLVDFKMFTFDSNTQ